MGFFFEVLQEALGIFLGFDFCPIRSSPSLEIRSTPPGVSTLMGRNLGFNVKRSIPTTLRKNRRP